MVVNSNAGIHQSNYKASSAACKMQSLVSLETVECYDPELQSYLKEHRWPATLEVVN